MFNNLRTIQLQSSNDNIGAGLRNPGPLRQPILRQGLVGEWLLNGNAGDSSGYGNNGTATNVTYSDTNVGYYRQNGVFNGSSSYIGIGDNSSIQLTTKYTIFCRIKMSSLPSSGNLYALVDKNFGGSGYEFELWNNSGTQTIFVSHWNAGTTTYSINYTLPVNVWIDLVVTFEGSTLIFYANGNIIGTVSGVTRTPAPGSSELNIGRSPSLSSRFYSGNISFVRIYNRVLSKQEIQTLYKEGLKLLH